MPGFKQRERLVERRLVELQQKLAIGLAQADQGELIDGEDVFADLGADIPEI